MVILVGVAVPNLDSFITMKIINLTKLPMADQSFSTSVIDYIFQLIFLYWMLFQFSTFSLKYLKTI